MKKTIQIFDTTDKVKSFCKEVAKDNPHYMEFPRFGHIETVAEVHSFSDLGKNIAFYPIETGIREPNLKELVKFLESAPGQAFTISIVHKGWRGDNVKNVEAGTIVFNKEGWL